MYYFLIPRTGQVQYNKDNNFSVRAEVEYETIIFIIKRSWFNV